MDMAALCHELRACESADSIFAISSRHLGNSKFLRKQDAPGGNRMSLVGEFHLFDIGGEIIQSLSSRLQQKTGTDYGVNMSLGRLLLKGIVASVVGVIGVLFVLHEDSSVHADVLIDRPPADVWKFLSNSAAYPEWNPFITRVEGDFREGATIRIVPGTGSDATVFEPTVLLVRPDQDLCWRGSVWVRGPVRRETLHSPDGRHRRHPS
jgi:hypothetical protein